MINQKYNTWLQWVSNLLLLYAASIGGIALYQRFDAWRLGGACPVPLQRPWLYSAVAAAILSLILIVVADNIKKRARG